MFARWREVLTTITPLTVLGVLVCCAIRITLVTVGAGSVVASMISTAPWLVTLSRNKEWVFLLTGLILATDCWILYRSRGYQGP